MGSTRRRALRDCAACRGCRRPLAATSSRGRRPRSRSRMLHALAGTRSSVGVRECGFPMDGRDGWPALFLQDQRPAGFLGRGVPQRFPNWRSSTRHRLERRSLPALPRGKRGAESDSVSNYIYGDAALDELSIAGAPANARGRRRAWSTFSATCLGCHGRRAAHSPRTANIRSLQCCWTKARPRARKRAGDGVHRTSSLRERMRGAHWQLTTYRQHLFGSR